MSRKTFFLYQWLVLSLLTAVSLVRAEESPCTIHDSGKYYDLTTLKSSKDYPVYTSSTQNISLNVCQSVRTELWGLKDIDAGDVGAFVHRGHGDFALGKMTTKLSIWDSRPRLTFSDGSQCKTSSGQVSDIKSSLAIDFVCDKTGFGPGVPRLVASLPPGDDEAGCSYVIEWKTHHACPTSEGGFWWTLFVVISVIFLSVLMAYTVLGVLYNRYVLQLRGVDQIPQFSIESMKYHAGEAYDWFNDILAGYHASRQGGQNPYASVPPSAAPRSATNPVSHYTQSTEPTTPHTGDVESSGSSFPSGFIRPQAGKNRASAFQRYETNPVSHQTQVNASLSFPSPLPSASSPAPPVPPKSPPTSQPVPTSDEQTYQAFSLEDVDADAEELVDVQSSLPMQATPKSPQPTTSATSPAPTQSPQRPTNQRP